MSHRRTLSVRFYCVSLGIIMLQHLPSILSSDTLVITLSKKLNFLDQELIPSHTAAHLSLFFLACFLLRRRSSKKPKAASFQVGYG